MENIFEVPNEIVGLNKIPVSDVIQGLDNETNSNLVESINSNNLTKEQSLVLEQEIIRSEKELDGVLSSNETKWEMWSYDDFDNAYNNGITKQEKQAFTYWIENRLGTSQKGFFKRYSMQRSDRQCVNFRDFDGEGVIDKVMSLMRLGVLFFDIKSGEYQPTYVFTTGNLYEKKVILEQNKILIEERFGEEIYNAHQVTLQNAFLKVYDIRIKLSGDDLDKCLKFDINSDMAKEIKLREITTSKGVKQIGGFRVYVKSNSTKKEFDKGKASSVGGRGGTDTSFQELTLREGFMWWLRYSQINESGGQAINLYGLTWEEIYNQYMLKNNKNLGSLTQQERFNKKEECNRVGASLWSEFLQRGLSGEMKVTIETVWNAKYNHNPNLWDMARCSYVDGDFRSGKDYELKSGGSVKMIQGQVPIGFTMAKRYGGEPTAYINDVRTDKRRSLSYCTMTNYQSLLAYGVGVGKTWCAIFQVAQALELGICKRPIFVLPNQVYPQFVKEIKSILPQYKVNALYNLRGEIAEELVEQGGVAENSITIVTETALEVMGFSKGYAEDGFLDNAFNTLNQMLSGEMSNKEREEMQKANNEIISDETTRGVKKVLIDKVKFDYVVVDEAHNYKKLVTSVKGKVIENPLDDEMDNEQLKDREKVNFQFGGGKPSSRALRLFYMTDYIQQFSKFGNTLLLTATPFTNNPLEVFSMLTYVDRNSLKKASMSASSDFFKTFGNMGFNMEATIQGTIKEKFTFLGWMNVPALQNLIFNNIDFIGADEINLKRPSKIVLPFKSLLNGETNETRILAREEQISSIITMTDLQKELIDKLKDYANGQIEWMPPLYEVVKDREKQITTLYPYLQSEIDKIIEDNTKEGKEFIAQESNWNTTSLIKDSSKIKWLVGDHEVTKRIKRTIVGNPRDEISDTLLLRNGYEPEQIAEVGSFSQGVSTKLLRSLTFQRQITISPYLFNASGLKEEPTPKEYIESSAKLKYVMGCIKSVKDYSTANNIAVSGQIIYMEFGIGGFPLIAQYLIEELGFEPQEVGIICGDKKMTRVMSSEGKGGKPKPQHKSIVQNCFNGLIQDGDGNFDKMKDSQRCKVLIGSETISEGMNLQFESSVIYQCFLPFNPTNQVQLEGRIWRQGNPYKFVRIVNPLCADSIDIFMFQKMQDKAKYINQIWNRNGQTFMIDAREFDANELKEACISNPYQLARFQTDEIKKEIQVDISKNSYEKSKFNNVKLMLDKSVQMQFGGYPSVNKSAKLEINQSKGGIDFNTFVVNGSSSMFSLYQMIRTLRPDMIKKDIFSDSFYEYLANMRSQAIKEYGEGDYQMRWHNWSGRIKIDETDLNYTLIEILTLTRDLIKDRKISLPFGFSKEALSEIILKDLVQFTKRGKRMDGVVVEIEKDEDNSDENIYVVEVEDEGKVRQHEIQIRLNDVKKIVQVKKEKKDEKEKVKTTIGWGTKEFLGLIPMLYEFTNGNSDYDQMFQSFWDEETAFPSLNVKPFKYDYADLLTRNSYHFNDATEFKNRYSENYDNDKKVRTQLNSNFMKKGNYIGSEMLIRYEPTYLREVENAFATFELQMKSQGINTITELNDKINEYDVVVERLNKELRNVGQGEKIQERAQQIILKREQDNAIKDQSLTEGDWKARVDDFASLNCILDMKLDEQNEKKLIIEEKEIIESEVVNLDEEPTEEVTSTPTNKADLIKMKINALEGLLVIYKEGTDNYLDKEMKINALQGLLAIYE